MKTKDRFFAIITKPYKDGIHSYWKAFSFNSQATLADIEAFMVSIHVYCPDYFLCNKKNLTEKKPSKGSSNARTVYYLLNRFVLDTPVSCSFEKRKENGVIVRRRCFKVR